MFKNLFGSKDAKSDDQDGPMSNVISTVGIPSWEELQASVLATSKGSFLRTDSIERSQGAGSPHTDNDLRLFGTTGEPRVTFYKDRASWCPYCQKVWILLEEKRIPYRVSKINMRSYGDKPREFLSKVPNGLLPAIEIDGQLQTDSIPIMMTLESMFQGEEHKAMWPTSQDELELARAQQLMGLERKLFGDWCNLVFRPSFGQSSARAQFEETLDIVNQQLSVTPGPFFLKELSIVDLQFVTHIERMAASVPMWKGFNIRGRYPNNASSRWPAIDAWFDAFEEMPSYRATRSDYYTHVQDIPPQYGPGIDEPGTGAEQLADIILGRKEHTWTLPLPLLNANKDLEPIKDTQIEGPAAEKAEAAYKLILNSENIVKFTCRGAGKTGAKRFSAPLADPYAVANTAYMSDVDAILRRITQLLLAEDDDAYLSQDMQLALDRTNVTKQSREDLMKCLVYLQRRVGVPRDMSYPAARQLRAHLGWAIDQLV